MPPERLVAAAGFDVPEGYRILSDERGVRIVPAGLTGSAHGRRRPPGSLAVIGGRLEDSNVAVFAEMHRLAGGRILVFPTASVRAQGRGRRRACRSSARHGFDAEVAPLTAAERRAASPTTRTLIARVARLRQRLFHRRRPGEHRRRAGARAASRRRSSPPSAPPRPPAASWPARAPGAAMMSQPMILGGTSIESVVHGVTADPQAAGPAARRRARLLPATAWSTSTSSSAAASAGWWSRWPQAGVRRGFGIDENTALLVEGAAARVCGEYGVMLDRHGPATVDPDGPSFRDFRLSYLDDGDGLDLGRFRPEPGAGKRRVRKREIAYRAPARSRRNVFGAYTLYDLMARLVLGDPASYSADRAEAFDARSGVNVTVEIERQPRRSQGPDRHARERPADVGARTSAARSPASS